jgi:lysozyme family protein
VNEDDQHAVRTLQRALRACQVTVDEDGNLGPKTIAAVYSVRNMEALVAAMRSEAASYYRLLAALHQRDEVFLKGWLNRAYE